jgi:hypothetical protein
MSTPAAVREAPAHPEPPAAPLVAPRRPARRLRPALVLPVLFVVAAAYHAVQSTMHVSPAIFTDELLHSKLAQSLAAGEGFRVRGEPVFFPAFLPAVLQAPAWLVPDMGTGYALAKLLNALVMSAAVFPAYWLARQLVRPSFALLTAAATVAAPAMLYHSYLLSEALAYPVFLLTVAVMVRALAAPSARTGGWVLAMSVLAVATRVQFVVLPLVFALLLLARPRELRRHAVPAIGLVVLAAAGLVAGAAALGTYSGLGLLDYDPLAALRWTAATAALLPFAAGWLVVPGALLGLGYLALRARTRAESAFAGLALGVAALFVAQAGLIGAGDSERALERYVIYLAPLAFVAFFAYVERGAPRRRLHAGLAVGLGALAWLVPFPSLADYRFSFDSPVLSAYGTLADWIGNANAATVFAAVPLLAGIALALRPPTAACARVVAVATVVLLVATGAVAYVGDHAMTDRARSAWAGSPPDWLDELDAGRADFLGLPGGSAHFAWVTEAWNRDFGRPLWLDAKRPANDAYAAGDARIDWNGALLVDGQPARGGLLVVNDYATRIGLEGEVVARPREGLTLLRVPTAPRVHSLARGLYHDDWSNGNLYLRVWPEDPRAGGVYHVTLSLPFGREAREVVFALEGGGRRVVTLAPGRSVSVELPVPGGNGSPAPLRITSERAEFLDARSPNPRLVAFRVDRLGFEPAAAGSSISL